MDVVDESIHLTVPMGWRAFLHADIGSSAYLTAELHAFVPVPDADEASLAVVFFLADGSRLDLARVSEDDGQARALAVAFSKAIGDATAANRLVKSGVQFDEGPGYRIRYVAPVSASDARVVAWDVVFFPVGGRVYRMTLIGADPVSQAVIDAVQAAAQSVHRGA